MTTSIISSKISILFNLKGVQINLNVSLRNDDETTMYVRYKAVNSITIKLVTDIQCRMFVSEHDINVQL